MKPGLILFMVGMTAIIATKAGFSEANEKGSQLFKERGCGACHDRTKDQTIYRLGPSLDQIAETYRGHESDLELFLKGGCDPIIDEARYEIMHGEIVKLKGLTDSQIRDLRKYICEDP